MEARSKRMVCRSLPKRCSLRMKNINPGAQLFNHSIMYSSITLTCDGKNCWAIFWFQAPSNWRMWKKPSLYGTYILVNWRSLRIESNRLWEMMSLSRNEASLAIGGFVVNHQSQRLSITTHHAMYSQEPTHFINSGGSLTHSSPCWYQECGLAQDTTLEK